MAKRAAAAYKIFAAGTLLFLAIYYLLNHELFAGYNNTLLLFLFASIIVIIGPSVDFAWLWISAPLSYICIAFFFRTHLFPEIMFLALNRLFLRGLSMIRCKKGIFSAKIVTVYINAVIFVVLAEIALNLLFFVKPMDILKRKYDVLRLQPGTIFNGEEVNRHGFLGRDISEEKMSKRLLFIGDSFGVGVVDYRYNFIKMVEDSLGFETVNLSQPGFSPLDYLSQLEQYGDSTNADFLFVIFFSGNDVYDLSMPENNWSFENLRLVSLLRNSAALLKTGSKGGSPDIGMTEEMFMNIERERSAVSKSKGFEGRWKLFARSIEKIAEKARQKKLPFKFILIPDESAIDTSLQKMIDSRAPEERWEYTVKRMEDVFKSNNIGYLDMTQTLLEVYSEGRSPYKKFDTHINEDGNYAVFRELKKYILSSFKN